MKEIRFKKSLNPLKRLKNFSISQRSADKKSTTYIRKSFIYHVVPIEADPEPLAQPELFIRKRIDSEKRMETFRLRVKGAFYMAHGRHMIRVRFYHTLNIRIYWKAKYFSPKKSVVLTK